VQQINSVYAARPAREPWQSAGHEAGGRHPGGGERGCHQGARQLAVDMTPPTPLSDPSGQDVAGSR
jgi:hypothetical protein